MYVIPLRKGSRKSLKFHEVFLDEQEDSFSYHDEIDNNIQTILTLRLSTEQRKTIIREKSIDGGSVLNS
jgi:hypothetical protein